MSKRMRRKSYASNTNFLPEYLEIPFKVPNGDLRIVLRAEQIAGSDNFSPLVPLEYETPKLLSKFARKGYEPLSISFPQDFENQVVKVYVLCRQSKNLTRSKARVKNRKGDKASTLEITCPACSAKVPLDNARHVCFVEST